MELTKIGMEMLIDRIERRKIVPPDDMELDRLTAYLLGYTNCDCDIFNYPSAKANGIVSSKATRQS